MTKSGARKDIEARDESFLDKVPREALSFEITVGDRTLISDLKTDMLLGPRRRENPFAIVKALDEQTNQAALWGSIVVQLEERDLALEEKLKVIKADAMNQLREALLAENKNPTIDTTKDAFRTRFEIFYFEGEGVLPSVLNMKEKAGKLKAAPYKKALKAYLIVRWEQAEVKRKLGLARVVSTQWAGRSYNLTAINNTIIKLIDNGILYLPKGKKLDIRSGKTVHFDIEGDEHGKT